ncbi:MAG TPA: porin [Duganella sp.]|nr:porin [Duganella sp.]
MNVNIALLRAIVAVVSLLGCSAALAGEDASSVTVGGFGTLGVVHSNNNQADFTANALNPGDAGASRAWSAAVDSRLGVQMALNLDSKWSAVLQLVSERTLRDSYAPVVEWANLQYQVTPDLSVRVGRIALPLFLTGDYRKAGYALPWVRPPVELYGAIPLSNSDGVDASYRWQRGDVHNVTQVSLGRADMPLAAAARAQARSLAGISNTATAGALTVRASVLTSELSVDIVRPLFDGLRGFGAQGQALADRYELSAKRAYVASIGFSYDPGQWFMMGEIGRMNTHSFLGDKTAAYAGAGRRYGDLAPYVVYAASRANMQTRVGGVDVGGLPPPQAMAGAQLNAGLNQLLAAIPRQYSITAGVRWDLCPNYALKLQYDRITPQQGSTGTFINVQPGFKSGQPITLLSAALDFVF